MRTLLKWIFVLALLDRAWRALEIINFFRRKNAVLKASRVDVAQAILGGDPALRECLEHNLWTVGAEGVRFLWLVDRSDSAGASVCETLRTDYPDKGIEIVYCPDAPETVSPKSFKLRIALQMATAEFFAVLDDDTMLPPGGLDQAIGEMGEARLACGLPYYVSFGNLWSSLASAFVNGNSLWTYIPYLRFSKPVTINGMFYIGRREDFVLLGGFAEVERYVCDDYHIARLFRERNWEIVQTSVRHAIRTSVSDWKGYVRLLTRWMVFPLVSIQRWEKGREALVFRLLGILPTIVPLLAWRSGRRYLGWYLASCIAVNTRYLGGATPVRAWPLFLVQAVLLPLHFVFALLNVRNIVWRGKRMRLSRNGELEQR